MEIIVFARPFYHRPANRIAEGNGALKDVKVRFIDKLAKFVELESFQLEPADTGASVVDFPGSNIIKSSRMDDFEDNPPF